jgi:FkbM family methyltransferase
MPQSGCRTQIGHAKLTECDNYFEVRRFILCDLIWQRDLLQTPLVVLDIGARNAFADTRWTGLPREMIRLHGFEPDDNECRVLNERAKAEGYNFVFHSVALAEHTGEIAFYQFAEPAANSLYPGNERLLKRWCYSRSLTLSSQFRLEEKRVIQAESLAEWAKQAAISDIDFCKLNVQGAELDILRGAGPRLQTMLGIVAEQTFNETYVGAPLFGEVYEFIRGAGFTMFDILSMNLVGRTESPIHITEDHIFARQGAWPHHQFFEGHFLYLRDPILAADHWDENSGLALDKALKLACLSEIFGQIEFAFEILTWLVSSPGAETISPTLRDIISIGAQTYRRVWNPSSRPSPVATEVERLTAEVGELRASLSQKLTENASLHAEAAACAAKMKLLENCVEQIHASRSWRLTAPFRSISLNIKHLFESSGGDE